MASRRGAEIDYLNRRAEKWESLDKNNSTIMKDWHTENPRWEKLLEVKYKKSYVQIEIFLKLHGDPIKIEKVDTTLNSKTIKIKLSAKEKSELINT